MKPSASSNYTRVSRLGTSLQNSLPCCLCSPNLHLNPCGPPLTHCLSFPPLPSSTLHQRRRISSLLLSPPFWSNHLQTHSLLSFIRTCFLFSLLELETDLPELSSFKRCHLYFFFRTGISVLCLGMMWEKLRDLRLLARGLNQYLSCVQARAVPQGHL